MIRILLPFLLVFGAVDAAAQTLSFPSNARLSREVTRDIDSYAMPVGPWAEGSVPSRTVEGALTQQAWQISATGLTALQLIRPLRDQLRNAGFTVVFECKDVACGGFDFRFAAPILPPPDMRVNLGDFRYLAAQRDSEDNPEIISIIASRSARTGYIHVTRVGPAGEKIAKADDSPAVGARPSSSQQPIGSALLENGRSILEGLAFETGSAQLGEGPFSVLQELADFLAASPTIRIALVGHTDSSGSLDGNIALSKRRAGSVRERLVSIYAVDPRQIDAQGMGYLSPIASNQTEDGRRANRRVEAIVTSTN